MKKLMLFGACVLFAFDGLGQGSLYLVNGSPFYTNGLTRIGSIDGPYAGPDIWAQFLGGVTPDDLQPIGRVTRHFDDPHKGIVFGQTFTFEDLSPLTTVYVQMAAWNGMIWGTDYNAVPRNQLGKTDTVPVELSNFFQLPLKPMFHQPAIVPPVPEPSVWAVTVLSAFGFLLFHRRPK